MSWLRTILKVGGSTLASYGYFTNASQWATITGVVLAVAGALMSQWEHESDTGPFTRFMVALGKSLPPPPAVCLLLMGGLIMSQSGCSFLASLDAPVGPVTMTGNSTTQGTTANGDQIIVAGNTSIDVTRAAALASTGIQTTLATGVPIAVQADPSLLPDFEAAQEGLAIFIQRPSTGSGYNSTQLLAIVNQGVTPANQAKIDLYINDGIAAWTIFYQVAGPYLSSNQEASYALEFLTAANAGLTAGIAASPGGATPVISPAASSGSVPTLDSLPAAAPSATSN